MRSATPCTGRILGDAAADRILARSAMLGCTEHAMWERALVDQSAGDLALQPSASYSFTMRVDLRSGRALRPRRAARSATQGAILGAIDLVRVEGQRGRARRHLACVDAAHGERSCDAVRALDGVERRRASPTARS